MPDFSGARMRQIREERHRTKEWLAVRSGRSYSSITKYESGYIVPSGRILGTLAAALNVGVDEFFQTAPADGA